MPAPLSASHMTQSLGPYHTKTASVSFLCPLTQDGRVPLEIKNKKLQFIPMQCRELHWPRGRRPAQENWPLATLRVWQDQGGGEETGQEGSRWLGRDRAQCRVEVAQLQTAPDTGVRAGGAGGSREKPEQGETTFYILAGYENVSSSYTAGKRRSR